MRARPWSFRFGTAFADRLRAREFVLEDAGLISLYLLFLDEANENLDRMERSLLAVGGPDAKPELVDSIYRCAHSIKGGAASFDLTKLTELMHLTESILGRWRLDRVDPDQKTIALLLEAVAITRRYLIDDVTVNSSAVGLVQRLKDAAQNLGEGVASRLIQVEVQPPHRSDLVEAVARMFRDIAGLGEIVGMSDDGSGRKQFSIRSDASEGELLDLLTLLVDRDLVSVRDHVPVPNNATTASGAADLPPGAGSVRVAVQELDLIDGMSRHLVDKAGRLHRRSQLLASSTEVDVLGTLVAEAAELQQLVLRLQDALNHARSAPVSEVFELVPQLLRSLSTELGKEFALTMSGQTTRIDRTVLQALVDPLIHIVRNACGHGIEPPSEREAAGKPRAGQIGLDAQWREGVIRIVVRDDGCGLSRQRLLQAARAVGLNASDQMRDDEVWQLVFLPGISTAAAVTQVSGRGVGMDVVRKRISAAGGRLEIESLQGKGTTVTIELAVGVAGHLSTRSPRNDVGVDRAR